MTVGVIGAIARSGHMEAYRGGKGALLRAVPTKPRPLPLGGRTEPVIGPAQRVPAYGRPDGRLRPDRSLCPPYDASIRLWAPQVAPRAMWRRSHVM